MSKSSSFTMSNMVFSECRAMNGIAAWISESVFAIRGVEISRNSMSVQIAWSAESNIRGSVFVTSSVGTIQDSRFLNNTITSDGVNFVEGGGIFFQSSRNLTLRDVRISNNFLVNLGLKSSGLHGAGLLFLTILNSLIPLAPLFGRHRC